MQLIGHYDSPFVRRVAVAMQLLGVRYEQLAWSVFADADKIARYNPLRRVPVLVLEDGESIIESHAIIDHLEATSGATLWPEAAGARRRAVRITSVATGAADKAVSLVYETRLREHPLPLWVERCTAQIRDALDELNAARAAVASPFFFGDRPGHADVAVACVWRFLIEAHASLFDYDRWVALQRHSMVCEALPAFQSSYEPFFGPTPAEPPNVFNPTILAVGPDSKEEGKGAPACSVVMTWYKDNRFVREAVKSVLDQDFIDFELIVVDDGSPDPEPVARLAALDERIRVVRLERNVGTAEAANRGIALARADIIARIDSDDLVEPGWLGRVLGNLHANPELGLVGSAVTLIHEDGRVFGVQAMPDSDLAIRLTLLFQNPFYHSGTAFRRSLFQAVGGYRADRPVSEDHYLWADLLPVCRARNISEPLVRYRMNSAGLTAANRSGDPRSRTEPIRQSLWKQIGLSYPLADRQRAGDLDAFLRGRPPADEARRADVRDVMELVLDRLEALQSQFLWSIEASEPKRLAAKVRSGLAAPAAPAPGLAARGWRSLRERGLRRTLAVVAHRLAERFAAPLWALRMHGAGAASDPITAALHGTSPYAGFNPARFPPDLQGWGSADPAFRALIAELRPALIVEVGSWKGASAIHMASLCREFSLDTRIICVDTWLGSTEHVLGLRPGWKESLRPRHGYPRLYYTFLANVLRSGHASRIIPLPNSSDNAAVVLRELGVRPELIYIDAAHEQDCVYRDLTNYWELLAPAGALLGDDFAKFPGVRQAVHRFVAETGASLDDRGDKYVLRRGAGG